jgi:hypothetical protein
MLLITFTIQLAITLSRKLKREILEEEAAKAQA